MVCMLFKNSAIKINSGDHNGSSTEWYTRETPRGTTFETQDPSPTGEQGCSPYILTSYHSTWNILDTRTNE